MPQSVWHNLCYFQFNRPKLSALLHLQQYWSALCFCDILYADISETESVAWFYMQGFSLERSLFQDGLLIIKGRLHNLTAMHGVDSDSDGLVIYMCTCVFSEGIRVCLFILLLLLLGWKWVCFAKKWKENVLICTLYRKCARSKKQGVRRLGFLMTCVSFCFIKPRDRAACVRKQG